MRLDRVRGGRQKYRRLIENPYSVAAAAAAAAASSPPARKLTLEGGLLSPVWNIASD